MFVPSIINKDKISIIFGCLKVNEHSSDFYIDRYDFVLKQKSQNASILYISAFIEIRHINKSLRAILDNLDVYGKAFGHNVKPSKCHFIVKENLR